MTTPHADHDPLRMTSGEKLAAEWEARHDAQARGSHANPAAVQDYLRHARSEEHANPAAHPHAAPHEQATPETPPKRSWQRRLFSPHR